VPLPLIRPEVVQARRSRLDGKILLRPTPGSWTVLGILLGFLAALIFLAASVPYAAGVTLQGSLDPKNGYVEVAADAAGLIDSVQVADYDTVAPGQPLFRIRVAEKPEWAGGVAAMDPAGVKSQRDILEMRIAIEAAERDLDDRRVMAARDQGAVRKAALSSQLAQQESTVRATTRQLCSLTGISPAGSAPATEYRRLRERLSEQLATLAALNAERHMIAQSDATLVRDARRLDAISDAEIGQLKHAINLLQERGPAGGPLRTVYAQVGGRVMNVRALVGQRTDGLDPLLAVLSDRAPLVACLWVPRSATSAISPGMRVRITYYGVNTQGSGATMGVVENVERVTRAEQQCSAPASFAAPAFVATVRLDSMFVDEAGRQVKLEPGQRVTAKVLQQQRSYLSLILTPKLRLTTSRIGG